jgi:hypothetical protein
MGLGYHSYFIVCHMFRRSRAIIKEFSIKQVEVPHVYKYDPLKHGKHINLILILSQIYIVLS